MLRVRATALSHNTEPDNLAITSLRNLAADSRRRSHAPGPRQTHYERQRRSYQQHLHDTTPPEALA